MSKATLELSAPAAMFALVKQLSEKLTQFRRHPDWGAALKHVWHTHDELTIQLDGSRAVPDDNIARIFELADQEFIEAIIRQKTISDVAGVALAKAEPSR